MHATESSVVDVAAAVILRNDGRFLLTRRPPGKVYAGYWEFPGGKVERGEALPTALARELHEELGLDVTRAYPWIVQSYVYPHAHVRLHFFRVLGWRGDPHPREEQALAWAAVHDLGVAPLLPANGPVLRALALPDRLGITRAGELGMADFLTKLNAALRGGLRMVMVREKVMQRDQLTTFAAEVVQRCHAAGALVVVNGDAELAAKCGADGVHLPAYALMHAQSAPQARLCGASCHDAGELARTEALRFDYAVLGPVLPTSSHPGQPAIGLGAFRRAGARVHAARLCIGRDAAERSGAGLGARRARHRHDARGLGLNLGLLGLVFRLRLALLERDAVALGSPLAEIDKLAALGAERAIGICRAQGCGCAAPWAVHHPLSVDRHHRLQNVSSKGTSVGLTRGRCAPAPKVKRMLSAYLFALTSGTHS